MQQRFIGRKRGQIRSFISAMVSIIIVFMIGLFIFKEALPALKTIPRRYIFEYCLATWSGTVRNCGHDGCHPGDD